MRPLDETLRRRLAELAENERSPLGVVERQRIVARAGELEPAARGGTLLAWALVGGAAVALMWQLAPSTPQRWAEPTVGTDHAPQLAAQHGAVGSEGPDGVPEIPGERPVTERPPCADAPVPDVAPPRFHGRDAEAIDLGDRARFVLFGDAEGRFEELERCRTAFVLERGRVLVHARDLAGGELTVRTPAADVAVRGTVFDVRLEPGSTRLRVAVAEGRVDVTARSGGTQTTGISPGEVVDVDGAASVRSSLAPGDVRSLLEAVSDAPRREPLRRLRPRPEAAEAAEAEPERPRGEVVGGVPQVHQPRWTSDP